MRNCLTWFWKLKSPKYTICKLEILGCWWCKSQSESKGLRTRKTNGINLNLRTRKDLHSISSCQGEFSLTQALFYPGLHWILKKAHPHWGGQSALLSRQIQMLTSSRNTDTPRIIFNQISQPLMAQSGWHVKLTITESFIPCSFRKAESCKKSFLHGTEATVPSSMHPFAFRAQGPEQPDVKKAGPGFSLPQTCHISGQGMGVCMTTCRLHAMYSMYYMLLAM